MSKFIIQGQNKLKGEIKVAGAKNCALKLLAASVLIPGECRFTNVPEIEEVTLITQILESLGAKVKKEGKGEYIINGESINKSELPVELASKIRSSIMFVAPLLARFGEVKFPYPGGCILGKRPIDMFLEGYQALGAEVTENEGYYHIKANKLTGCKYVFPWISHTVTESMIMAAVLAEGETTLMNAAGEPEVAALIEFLQQGGAQINCSDVGEIKIKGVAELSGSDYQIIPDRLEAGTFAILGALAGEEIKITNCDPSHLEVFWKMLSRAGVDYKIGDSTVTVQAAQELKAGEIRTHEYPGLATDLQAPLTVLMTQAEGISLVHETIYEGRLFYTDSLNKMGANIVMCDPHRVVVNGPTKLYGTELASPDIRAGIALVLAALIAEGESVINNAYQIDRGYEDIEGRLKALGADITREK
ncbi:MAG: UDP-N-acetylglucosamine 1-carboxyvinyltransferase [Parcubacteria group bacterium]|nr:UDP-N-acetylglucosamine 1-carboxyvinyltransferase [Parcubacteria group bacterium]